MPKTIEPLVAAQQVELSDEVVNTEEPNQFPKKGRVFATVFISFKGLPLFKVYRINTHFSIFQKK